MDNVRDGEHFLATTHMVTWLTTNQQDWLSSFIEVEDSAYKKLMEWCRRFAARHGFTYRIPCPSKLTQLELHDVALKYRSEFWSKMHQTDTKNLINVDETLVYYDMPPGRTLARRGSSSRVKDSQKHSDKISVVMGIRADGRQLPPLIIVKGTPGGPIEVDKLPTYPPGPIYAVRS
ncbi:hypothetical protein LEN26_017575 [Aphanomyces euteiches]|nr:hypothetical protein LEN26_017575 [Aphanomyces euteiches]KAH9114584.1 hypothetical protein AeMF1_011334 [Aphanomyces euteiches]KAH9186547.1 hypothetical protein AeNC1_011476 [Aphanomyces euteiches]